MNNNIIEEFKCKKCWVTKSIDNFSKRKLNKLWINYTCKECMSKYNKKMKDRHIDLCTNNGTPDSFICKECWKEKPITSFRKRRWLKYWYSLICLECLNKKNISKEIPTHKTCSICWRELPIDLFPKNVWYKDLHLWWCNECNAEKQRYYRKNRTEEQKNKDLEYHKNKKNKLYEYINSILLEKWCGICWYNISPAALEFHHKDPTNKTKEVSYLVSHCRNKEVIDNEINKCIIVCANCHREITAGELNRYK